MHTTNLPQELPHVQNQGNGKGLPDAVMQNSQQGEVGSVGHRRHHSENVQDGSQTKLCLQILQLLDTHALNSRTVEAKDVDLVVKLRRIDSHLKGKQVRHHAYDNATLPPFPI